MPTQELTTIDDAEQALIDNIQGDIGNDDDLVVPVLKVAQSLTKEVTEGDAKPGDFVNSLTGENFGNTIDFVVSAYQKGRFLKDKETGRSYAALGDVAPSSWPEEYAGRPFVEIEDAEERYKERVNAGEIAWEKGPAISTTHNFIGYVDGSEVPVRLSLMRTATPAARKLKTMLRFSRAPWDQVFTLKTEKKSSQRDEPYHNVSVAQGGPTTAEQRQRAVALAQATQSGRVSEASADDLEEKIAKPKKGEGALDV